MRPIQTPRSNAVLNAAPEDANVLPMHAEVRGEGIHSTWELTDEERAMIAEGAVIELGVSAEVPPPVGLAVMPPFHGGARMEWSPELKSFVCPVVEPE